MRDVFVERIPASPIVIVSTISPSRQRGLSPSQPATILHIACTAANRSPDHELPASTPGKVPDHRPQRPIRRRSPASGVGKDCRLTPAGDGRMGQGTFLAGVHRMRTAARVALDIPILSNANHAWTLSDHDREHERHARSLHGPGPPWKGLPEGPGQRTRVTLSATGHASVPADPGLPAGNHLVELKSERTGQHSKCRPVAATNGSRSAQTFARFVRGRNDCARQGRIAAIVSATKTFAEHAFGKHALTRGSERLS